MIFAKSGKPVPAEGPFLRLGCGKTNALTVRRAFRSEQPALSRLPERFRLARAEADPKNKNAP